MTKKFLAFYLFMSLIFCQINMAQDVKSNTTKIKRNYLNFYLGFIEWNLNYEINILQLQKSYSNIRFGVGSWGLIEESGYYLNPSVVHIFGKNNSHLELNLGIKIFFYEEYMDSNILSDIFVGYRFEKPNGRFVFRTGLNYPTVINLGFGFKF